MTPLIIELGVYLVIPHYVSLQGQDMPAWEKKGHQEILSSLTFGHSIDTDEFNVVWENEDVKTQARSSKI